MDDMEKIRRTIRKASPEATETVKYGIPTFVLNGKNLISFAAYKTHLGVYPVPKELHDEAGERLTGKATLRLALGEPIPLELIAKIVRFRAASILGK